MKKKTRGFMVLLTVCVMAGILFTVRAHAENTTDENGFTVDDSGTLVAYTGPGGSITIPSNVTSIAGGVFASNASISSVSIPASVTSIGTAVFYDCTGLKSVSIDANIGSLPAQTFYNCTSLSTVALNSGISSIGSQAFAECRSLSSISLPSSVTSIGDKAFYDCTGLSAIAVPGAVTTIGSGAFDGCTRLTSISVSSGNSSYASNDGCLYNQNVTRLIRCPQGKSSVSVATTTQTIGSGSFDGCRSLSSISLPESVKTIEANAFTGSGISSITIPATTNTISAQSNWKPAAISGYINSQAKKYADANGITFHALDAQQEPTESGNDGSESSESGNGTNASDAAVSDGSENSGNESDGNSSTNITIIPGTTVPIVGAATNDSSGASERAAANDSSGAPERAVIQDYAGATVTSEAHEKDETPKTGDGINPAFYMCLAVLLAGVCCFLLRKKTVDSGQNN